MPPRRVDVSNLSPDVNPDKVAETTPRLSPDSPAPVKFESEVVSRQGAP